MLADIKRVNPKQYGLIKDTAPHSAAICPRRAGKSYAGAAAALITGEAKPDAISIIISLNLKQLRRLYWSGAPSGLFTLNRKYNLGLTVNNSMLRWEHENGSIGYLMGAEDEEQLEVLRGMEADLYLIDECKSFIPSRLSKLINEIIAPQRATRQGRLILIGTPGNILAGPFYDATCPSAVDKDGKRFSVDYGTKDPDGRTPEQHRLWSRHHWTLQDNTVMAHQWDEALITKNQPSNQWPDDHPTWLREYLGLWAAGGDGLVYRYADERPHGRVTWVPQRAKNNPTGLPQEDGPWRLVGGLDIGFEDRTAFVLAAYSTKLRVLRHVWDISAPHMLIDDVADMLTTATARFGTIEKIFADNSGLAKMIVESLKRKGFPLEAAEKREKNDFIELLNSAFTRGEVQIVQGTPLEEQLLLNAWDLSDGTREELARQGKLREDDAVPNDSTDALLYLYRGSLHQFGMGTPASGPAPGTPEWIVAYEREQLKRARVVPVGDPRISNTLNAPRFVRTALERGQCLPTPGRFKTRNSF
jgi:hypothetical protein